MMRKKVVKLQFVSKSVLLIIRWCKYLIYISNTEKKELRPLRQFLSIHIDVLLDLSKFAQMTLSIDKDSELPNEQNNPNLRSNR